MQIALTHRNADFDALSSLVLATFLYPDTIGIIPRQMHPSVKEFLGLHREIFQLRSSKDVSLNNVKRLIIVDTNNWRRIENGDEIKMMNIPEIILWDHHIKGKDINAHILNHFEMGSTTTIMMQEMIKQGIAFTPMHATLFLLGIYDDTGGLTYPVTQPEDARVVAYLLENGADLNIVNSFLSGSFNEIQQGLLSQMLKEAEIINVRGIKVGISQLFLETSVSMLSQVVDKFRELSGVDACFGIFSQYDKSFVIGRSILPDFDAGSIIRQIGGGGHSGAASAVVNDIEPVRLFGFLKDLVMLGDAEIISITSLTFKPKQLISPQTKIKDAMSILEKSSAERCLIVFDKDRFEGIVDRHQIEIANSKGDDERFIGIVTRNDIMLHLYDI
ncbi:MAG: DHH family phosphoesterase [Thermodesulfovibrionales bacterium]|nr:DHH family phosphoesterase [Thermodesulfovibrionales bacterium]